jgi:hypothetical protein
MPASRAWLACFQPVNSAVICWLKAVNSAWPKMVALTSLAATRV